MRLSRSIVLRAFFFIPLLSMASGPLLLGVPSAEAAALQSPGCTVGHVAVTNGQCQPGGNGGKAGGGSSCSAVEQGTATTPCGRGTTTTLTNEGNVPGCLSNDHATGGNAGQSDAQNPHCGGGSATTTSAPPAAPTVPPSVPLPATSPSDGPTGGTPSTPAGTIGTTGSTPGLPAATPPAPPATGPATSNIGVPAALPTASQSGSTPSTPAGNTAPTGTIPSLSVATMPMPLAAGTATSMQATNSVTTSDAGMPAALPTASQSGSTATSGSLGASSAAQSTPPQSGGDPHTFSVDPVRQRVSVGSGAARRSAHQSAPNRLVGNAAPHMPLLRQSLTEGQPVLPLQLPQTGGGYGATVATGHDSKVLLLGIGALLVLCGASTAHRRRQPGYAREVLQERECPRRCLGLPGVLGNSL